MPRRARWRRRACSRPSTPLCRQCREVRALPSQTGQDVAHLVHDERGGAGGPAAGRRRRCAGGAGRCGRCLLKQGRMWHTWCMTSAVAPEGLQQAVDAAVQAVPRGAGAAFSSRAGCGSFGA